MTDPATGERTFLQALKVPFDLKGVALGACAFLVVVWGAKLLSIRTDPFAWARDLAGGGGVLSGLGVTGGDLWKMALLKIGVAALFGVACCRIAALRLARDEGLGLGEAVGFAVSGLGATLGAFAFMAGAMGFFYACNALAGLLSGVPGVGPLLMVVLFPLVLLSGLVLFLLAFGSLFGLPLVLAGLAVERNGALDAVSRGFSYVFSRPVLFFFYGITVYAIATLLLTCSLAMEGLIAWSFTHWFPDGESWQALSRAVERSGSAIRAVKLPDFTGVGGSAALGGWVAWLFGTGFHLALMGWVVYYFFGGATAAYVSLRRDVDGTEDEEIWIEGESDGTFGEPERPEPPGKGTPGGEAAGPPG